MVVLGNLSFAFDYTANFLEILLLEAIDFA